MPFEKGHKLGKGRPKGSPNKITTAIQEVLATQHHEFSSRLDFDKMSQDQLLRGLQIVTGYLAPKKTEQKIDTYTNVVETFVDRVMSHDPEELHKKILDGLVYKTEK